LLTIAAGIKDFDFDLFDMKGEYDLEKETPPHEELTHKLLQDSKPDIVGLTIITSEFDASLEIFKAVKRYDPSIVTVAGGLHTTLCPEDFSDPAIDVVCPGQSANQFRKVVEAQEKRLPFDNIPGIFINTPQGFHKTSAVHTSWDAAGKDFLMPDRSLLTRWRSTYKVGNNIEPSTYIFTSQGCPYEFR